MNLLLQRCCLSCGPVPLFLLGLLTAGGLPAATLVQTGTFDFVPDGSQALVFKRFDTNLGTLESVSIAVSATKSGGSYAVDNDSAVGGTVNLTHSVEGQLSSATVSLKKSGATSTGYVGQFGNLTASNTMTATIGATGTDDTKSFNATGGSDYVSFQPGDRTVSDAGTIHSAFLEDYMADGLSSFAITYAGSQRVNASGVSGLQQTFTVSRVSGSVTVTYNYTPAPVPEPPVAGLGGLGLLALLRRRR